MATLSLRKACRCGATYTAGQSCPKCKPVSTKIVNERRGSASSQGYGVRWRAARAGYLAKHPLCRVCEERGRVELATVVDHINPHRGDMLMFWDVENNWQPLCKTCHDTKTATEDGGFGNRRSKY